MGLSCFRAISGLGRGWVGWDLCAGLFYEHRFAMLIIDNDNDGDADDNDDAYDAGIFPSALLAFHCFWRRFFCSLPLNLGIF